MQVTAIFDIGKTNKKFFLFDEQLHEVHHEYAHFDELPDDDGYPGDDLPRVTAWMQAQLASVAADRRYELTAVNFSTYGATLVHLNESGKPVTPLYNYTKPFPDDLLAQFYAQCGGRDAWATTTASPPLGMLNSGLQLYWLKYHKPDVFKQIRHVLHFPQYFFHQLTGELASEYTSLGCHTGLWDFEKQAYHDWVREENVQSLFPAIYPTTTTVSVSMGGKPVRVGVGIHDSSAALLPYVLDHAEPFLLLSTGTWNICLNPFNEAPLASDELTADCLNYLQMDGKPVKASRLFVGNEYNHWIKRLAAHFGVATEYHRRIAFDEALFQQVRQMPEPVFKWVSLPLSNRDQLPDTDLGQFNSYELAYHALMHELMDRQLASIRLARGNTPVKRLYVDGGFVDNELFVRLLKRSLPDYELITTQTPLGSALGAAIAVNYDQLQRAGTIDFPHLQKQARVSG